MSVMKCRECRLPLGSSDRRCPSCGTRSPRSAWWLRLPVAVFGAFAVVYLVAFLLRP